MWKSESTNVRMPIASWVHFLNHLLMQWSLADISIKNTASDATQSSRRMLYNRANVPQNQPNAVTESSEGCLRTKRANAITKQTKFYESNRANAASQVAKPLRTFISSFSNPERKIIYLTFFLLSIFRSWKSLANKFTFLLGRLPNCTRIQFLTWASPSAKFFSRINLESTRARRNLRVHGSSFVNRTRDLHSHSRVLVNTRRA